MPILMTHGESSIVISGDLTTYLNSIGEVIGNITEQIFYIKSDKTATDLSAEFSSTNITYNGNIIQVSIDDWSNLLVDTEYYHVFGIKFSGDSTFREMKVKSNKEIIKFTQDIIRS